MRTRILAWMALFVILGCTGVPDLFERVDDDVTIDQMTGNILAGTPTFDTTYVELNVEKYKSRDKGIFYSLIVEYSSDDWLFIGEGESLVLTVHEQQIALNGRGSSSHRDIGYAGRIHEKAWYVVPFEVLHMIANAEDVKVKIIGPRHHVERYFSGKNFQNLREFIKRHAT